jgi:hypothetical protein
MTVQLSTLRVSADLDAGKYLSGARAMTAANQSVAASGTAAGASVTATQTKVNSAGDVWQRLSRQYVDGAGNEQKMTAALRSLQRGIDTGNVSMLQAEQILDGLNRKLGVTANAEELAANGQYALAQAVSTVNARLAQQEQQHGRTGRAIGLNAGQLQNLSFQVNDVISGIAMGQAPLTILAQQGGQVVQVLGMAEGGIGAALAGLLPILIPVGAAIGVVALLIAGLTSAIDENSGKTVSWGDTLKAVFQTIGDGIGAVFGPVFSWVSGWFSDLVQLISPGLKAGINLIVGGLVGAFTVIKDTWSLLPAALGDLVIQGSNGIIGAVQNMLNAITHTLNDWIADINSKIQQIPEQFRFGWQGLGTFGDVQFGRIDNPYAGSVDKANAIAAQDRSAAFGFDYAGAAFGDLQKHALENAANDNKKKKKTAGGKGATFSDLMDDAATDTATLTAQAAALGQSSTQTAYLEEKQKLLNKAVQQHIALTPDQISKIDAAAQAFGKQKGILESLTAAYDISKDAFKGLFTDLFANEGKGESFWHAFRDAAFSAIVSVENKLIDLETSKAFDALWSGGTTDGSGGIGGFLGGILKGFGFGGSVSAPAGLSGAAGDLGVLTPGFARGGYTGHGGKFEPAGIVHRGEFVFDAAATSRLGVGRLNALRGYADGGLVGGAANQNGAATFNLTVIVDGVEQQPQKVTQTKNASGGSDYVAIIDRATAKNVATPGSQTNRANKVALGARQQLTRRGS